MFLINDRVDGGDGGYDDHEVEQGLRYELNKRDKLEITPEKSSSHHQPVQIGLSQGLSEQPSSEVHLEYLELRLTHFRFLSLHDD